MHRRLAALGIVVTCLAGLVPSAAAAGPDLTTRGVEPIAATDDPALGGPVCEHAPDRVLVRFAQRGARARQAAYASVHGRRIRAFRAIPGLEVVSAPRGVEQAIQALEDDPAVAYVEPDCLVGLDALPDDPSFAQQWDLRNEGQDGGTPGADIQAEAAWDVRTDASTVIVAVIDTGVDVAHPDLAPNAWVNAGEIGGNWTDDDGNGYVDDVNGWDFVYRDATPDDPNSHGTHVAGTIGARGDNGVGVTGVAWQVRLMALRAFGPTGTGQMSTIVEAIDYAVANGARVINCSFSTPDFSRSMYDAIAAAGDAGAVTVASAGNDTRNVDEVPAYPAGFRIPTLVSVASTSHTDALSAFSNRGIYNVHLAAPGEGIVSTLPGGAYGQSSGTSMAAPHVSGVAALLAAEHPAWTAREIRDRLVGTTRIVPALAGSTWTSGILDAGAALAAGPTVLPPADPVPTPMDLAVATVADPNPAPAPAPAPPDFPTPEAIDTSFVDMGPPEIAMGPDGTRYVAYARRLHGVVMASSDGGAWTSRDLTSGNDDPYDLDLALDPAGTPRVAMERTWTDLAAYADPGIVVVDGAGDDEPEGRVTAACPGTNSCFQDRTPRMAIDAAGTTHLVFTRTAATSADSLWAPASPTTVPGKGLYYAVGDAGGWTVTRLLDGGNGGEPAIAVAADGVVHVVVQRLDGSSSGLYHLTNDGGSWSMLRLTTDASDTSPAVAVGHDGDVTVLWARRGLGVYLRQRAVDGGWGDPVLVHDADVARLRLAIDADDKLHLAVGLTNGFTMAAGVAYLTNASGAWVATSVAGHQAMQPSIAVDASGHPSIAYLEYSHAPVGLFVATDTGDGFVPTLVRERRLNPGSQLVDQVVDADGHSHVVIGRHTVGARGVDYATDASGTWVFERVSNDEPNAVSIRLDASGRPVIAYMAGNPPQSVAHLVYAERGADGWTPVDAVTSDIDPNDVSMVIAPDGTPHLFYRSLDSQKLKRARLDHGSWVTGVIYASTGVSQPTAIVDPQGRIHVALIDGGVGVTMLDETAEGWNAEVVAAGSSLRLASVAVAPDGALWIASWQVGHGVWAYTNASGAWVASHVGTSPVDAHPSITVDAEGRVRFAYSHAPWWRDSGCTVPMCPDGPGLHTAVLEDGAWVTTKLSAYRDTVTHLTSGPNGAVRLLFYRRGLRVLTVVQGKDMEPPGAMLGSPASPTAAATLAFSVAFTEPVSGLDATDVTVSGTATGCLVGDPVAGEAGYVIEVSGCSEGDLVVRLAAGSIVDEGGNPGPVADVESPTITIDRTAPTATAPTIRLRAGATLSGTQVPVTLRWGGDDTGGSGVETYVVERSIDGGATWTEVASGIEATSLPVMAPSRDSIAYRVQALDRAANRGAWATSPAFTARLVQDGARTLVLTGHWKKRTSSSFSGGSVRAASAAGASVTHRFQGTSIAFVTTRAPSRGAVRIVIDGERVATLRLDASSRTTRYVAWKQSWSTAGWHTIRVVVVGTSGHPRVDADAFVVVAPD